MNSAQIRSIETTWKVILPSRFTELEARVSDATHVTLAGSILFSIPFPPLDAEEIIDSAELASDWDLPTQVVPIIGDFHNLICLDYRTSSIPSVIALDDDRNEKALFETLDSFIDALIVVPDKAADSDDLGIIESKTWIDF